MCARRFARTCAAAAYVCAPYVKCCVGSVTGQGTSLTLPYLPPSTPMSRSAQEERARMYSHVRFPVRAFMSDPRTNVTSWTWRGTYVRRREVHAGTETRIESARLPPVKATGAVVPLCCGTLCPKGGGLTLSLP